MKRLVFLLLMIFTVAMPMTFGSHAETSFQSWPFFAEVSSGGSTPGIYRLVLPLQIMDKAREDLTDLRLIDAAGREIPYALRVRKEVNEQREFGARLFNNVTAGNVTEVSVDLGANPGEHNEIEIETAGTNFRRRVDVEGSDTTADWKTLKSGAQIFEFESQSRVANSNHVTYPLSLYRYLRLRIHADELTDKTPPQVSSVKALMVVRGPGLLTTWDVGTAEPQFLRNEGVPSSAWTIDLGGRVPCDRLVLTVDTESFSRQFQLEMVDHPENLRLVSAGELTHHVGEAQQTLTIRLDEEVYARKLRLLVNDFNNPGLSISGIQAGAPARELYFELKQPPAQPLRLYFGYANAMPPHYDFEKELSGKLTTMPAAVTLGSYVSNPDYRPEPLPFTERVPWLIYVVLTISSLALAWILFSLARATTRMQPEVKKEEPGTA
jgi:Protein of unknown function (DUF3999)